MHSRGRSPRFVVCAAGKSMLRGTGTQTALGRASKAGINFQEPRRFPQRSLLNLLEILNNIAAQTLKSRHTLGYNFWVLINGFKYATAKLSFDRVSIFVKLNCTNL
jgi:hypothetical protein